MATELPSFTRKEKILELIDATYRSSRFIGAYRAYVEKLGARGLPILLNPRHLSFSMGIEYQALLALSYGTRHFYRTFSIPKASGGFRRIDAPLPSLKAIQVWLLREIFERLEVHSSAMGFIKDISILDHVKPHTSNREMLRLDIEGFFPSIKSSHVTTFLHSLGYSKRISQTIAHLVTLDGSLPQGSPCSPMISNLLFKQVDECVHAACAKHGFTYTRYADDIAISSGTSLSDEFILVIKNLIRTAGFEINHAKTRHFTERHSSWSLVGLTISRSGLISIPRRRKKHLRQQVHFVSKFAKEDLMKENLRSLPEMLYFDRLFGLLAFWRWAEPDSRQALSLESQLRSTLGSFQEELSESNSAASVVITQRQ